MGVGIGGGGQFACFSSGQGGSGSLDFTLSNWLTGSTWLPRGICSLASALRSWGVVAYPTQGRIGNIKAQVLLCRGQGARLMENEGINGRSFVQDWLL